MPRIIVLASLLTLTSTAHAEVTSIWALDDGSKVKQTDREHPLKAGNLSFDPKSQVISLRAARNETVAFQLILQGGQERTQDVSVSLANVGDIKNRGHTPFHCGRHIDLFLQRYVQVDFPSRDLVWEPWTDAQPRGFTGMIPDPLVPLPNDHSFSVAANSNQGLWVDIYVDKDTKPGVHKGTLQVLVAGKPCALPTCNLSVELQVIAATLPEQPTSKTMLWFSGGDNDREQTMNRYFAQPREVSDKDAEAWRARHFQLARRHRVTLFIGQDQKPTEALQRRIDGSLFTPQAGYHGPGQGIGQDIYSIHTYGYAELGGVAAKMWHNWFQKHGPDVELFYYTLDEPTPEQFPEVNRRAKNAAPVPAFVTARYDPRLSVDIFAAVPNHYRIADKNRVESAGKRYWIYNGVRPFSGTFVIDDVAISPRVNPWIQYKYGIARWFYWEATYYTDFQGGRGPINMFQVGLNFTNRHGDRLNGDGLLMYPGRDLIFPDEDLKLEGPVPSIRLKNWRRGIQDVEYLVLARNAGMNDFVDRLLNTMIGAALGEVKHSDEPVAWREDGQSWLRARRLLGQALTTGNPPDIPADLAIADASVRDKLVRSAKRLKRKWWRGKRRLVVIAGTGLVGFVGLACLWWLARRYRRRARYRP